MKSCCSPARARLGSIAVSALLLSTVVALLPALSATALPPAGEWEGWADGPVRFLLTDEELRRWETVREDEAERFIDLMWSRRDPDLSTPVNEMKQEFDRRVAIADAQFGGEGARGSLTDRGRVLILLGEPRAVQQRIGGDQVRQYPERLVREGDEALIFWEYDAASLPVKLPAARLLIGFYEKVRGSGEFVLDRSAPGATLVLRALRRAPEAFVVHPDLQRPVHPVHATPLPEEVRPAAGARPPAEEPGRERSAAIPDPELAGWFLVSPPPWPEGARLLVVGGVRDGSGQRPAWPQLELPEGAPRVERMAVRWQPEGTSAPAEAVLVEVPFERLELNRGVAYQASLPLPPGEHAVGVAVGAGPRPVAVGAARVVLDPIPAEGVWLSDVYVAPHVEQRADEPLGTAFHVAGWHLWPDPALEPGQDLSYFGYLVTPPGAAAPEVEVSISLSQEGQGGGAPFREALQPSPVADGLWMYGSSIVLGGLPPGGEYRLKFEVRTAEGGDARTTRVPVRTLPPV